MDEQRATALAALNGALTLLGALKDGVLTFDEIAALLKQRISEIQEAIK